MPPQNPSTGENPFSTRYVRPGAMAYVFPEGVTADSLLRKLEANQWWGQIVGPHGSGKSTLLETLLARVAAADRQVEKFTLRQNQRSLAVKEHAARWNAATLVVVDGFEQLGWWSRRTLLQACRKRRAGLLVTSHRDVGLPLIAITDVTLELAQSLVRELASRQTNSISDEEIAASFRRAGGDMRETLFSLFDIYESQRRRPTS